MASPKQRTVGSLRLASEACNAALDSLKNPSHRLDGPDLHVLLKDFLSILSLLYGSTTKLSLTLKPSSPAYATSQEPLKDIITQISALSHCVRLFGGQHGITLVQEIASVAKDVVQSVQSLLQVFLAVETREKGSASTGKVADEHMVKVGAVHDIIDNAQAGLSKDNAGAVQKKLSQNHAAMRDGLGELDDMITDKNEANYDQEDDGWGELGLDTKTPMTDDERERSRKVYAILRLSSTLHERIMRDVSAWSLVTPSEWHSHIIGYLDSLPPQSSALAIAFDELVSATYTPQDPSDLSSELSSLVIVIGNIRSNVLSFPQDPDMMKRMEVAGSQGSNISRKDVLKWFETCFNQIEKAVEALQSILNIDS